MKIYCVEYLNYSLFSPGLNLGGKLSLVSGVPRSIADMHQKCAFFPPPNTPKMCNTLLIAL